MFFEKDISNTALLVIDVQKGLFKKNTPIYHEQLLVNNINTLILRAHEAELPVIFIRHADNLELKIGTEDWQIHDEFQVQAQDEIIDKTHSDAFLETNLGTVLKNQNIRNVIVTGLITHGCVRATCLGAKKAGYQAILVSDAHSSYSEKAAALIDEWNQKIQWQNIQVKATEEILFE